MTRRSTRIAALALLLLCAGSAGCAWYTPLPTLGADLTRDGLDPDERHLWKQARELQHRLDTSGLVFEDPELEAYLSEIARKVGGEELRAAGVVPRVRVLAHVDMHAFAFADGAVYVHTALLARMENEAQLATMLSRELAHVIHRHSLQAHRDKKAQSGLLAWTGLAASGLEGGAYAQLALEVASASSMQGYHWILETQADRKGLERMAAAGYDLREAPRLFEMTIEYLEEVHAQGPAAGWPFFPPAHVTTRITAYRNLIAQEYADAANDETRIRDTPRFAAAVHGARLRQAGDELDAGRFRSAETTARLALAHDDRDPAAWVLLGEALSEQRDATGATPHLAEARAAWRRALELDRRSAPAHRALGMSFYRGAKAGGTTADARSRALRHFERYLALAPRAVDAVYVRRYIEELRGEASR